MVKRRKSMPDECAISSVVEDAIDDEGFLDDHLYYDLHDKYISIQREMDSILDDVVLEMELVKQLEVNIDYTTIGSVPVLP